MKAEVSIVCACNICICSGCGNNNVKSVYGKCYLCNNCFKTEDTGRLITLCEGFLPMVNPNEGKLPDDLLAILKGVTSIEDTRLKLSEYTKRITLCDLMARLCRLIDNNIKSDEYLILQTALTNNMRYFVGEVMVELFGGEGYNVEMDARLDGCLHLPKGTIADLVHNGRVNLESFNKICGSLRVTGEFKDDWHRMYCMGY